LHELEELMEEMRVAKVDVFVSLMRESSEEHTIGRGRKEGDKSERARAKKEGRKKDGHRKLRVSG
jgi:hypothetical protein